MKREFSIFVMFWTAILVCCTTCVVGQAIEARIEILSPENCKIRIEGKSPKLQTRWKFLDYYANANNLTARIENLKFHGEQETAFKNTGAGEFETEQAANNFSYELKLDFPANVTQAAHVSSLIKENGILMTADLLPDFGEETTAKIKFVLPRNWKIATTENKIGENEFQTANYEKAVFLVGNFDEQTFSFDEAEINLARIGDWSFSEEETAEFVLKILAEHHRIFGSLPARKIQIFLLPFPQKHGGEQWEAETRGSTVVLFAAQIPFKSRALSKLHEQLRHEIFHLWIPNALNLRGDYAWFYEGFAIYQALKTGVRLKQIRFEDFLDTLSRAFDITNRTAQNKTLNLLEASRLRWSGNLSEFVYAKGMIVAFLCDLALLRKSKKNLDAVFNELYRKHQKTTTAQDANQAVLEILKSQPEMHLIVKKYVETAGEIDWTAELSAAGLQNAASGSLTRLTVAAKLNSRQKKLLAKLVEN